MIIEDSNWNKRYVVLEQTDDKSDPFNVSLKVFDLDDKTYKTIKVPLKYFR